MFVGHSGKRLNLSCNAGSSVLSFVRESNCVDKGFVSSSNPGRHTMNETRTCAQANRRRSPEALNATEVPGQNRHYAPGTLHRSLVRVDRRRFCLEAVAFQRLTIT